MSQRLNPLEASLILSEALPSPDANKVRVRHYVAGGREHGGGIGRLVGYIVENAAEIGPTPSIVDTRGPNWSVPTSVMRLLSAILVMATDRVVSADRIHHIHIAGRGSTLRKLILAGTARSLRCKHILHLHDYDYTDDFKGRSTRQQGFVRRMFRGADHVIVLGQGDRDMVATLLGVAPARISISHNCVPDPGPRSILFNQTPLILFLGRLSERKGVPELLAALSSPEMARLRWRAILAGDGPVDKYRQQAVAMGLSDRVEMPGWLSADAIQILSSRADILALPSHAEGMAMSVIEGLAHGLAIVTTRVGAHEEAITDGKNGLFVPVAEPAALAMTLAKLVSEPELRRTLSGQARVSYLSYFSMSSYLRSLEMIYQSVSDGHLRVPLK